MSSSAPNRRRVNRRTFIGAAGGVTAAAAIGPLAGCSKKDNKNTIAKNTKVKLPTHVAYKGQRPDLQGTAAGVQNGFLRYPANPGTCTDGKPGKGGSISMLGTVYGAVPPGPPKNKYWANLNAALGTELKVQSVLNTDMQAKLATVLAGNDIPDVVMLSGSVPNTPQLLEKRFQDLTEFLSGDAVKDFPLLADFTEEQWKTTVYNGGIYGLPIPRERCGGIMYRRDDVFTAKGIDPNPKTYADFTKVCAALTDAKHGKYASSGWGSLIGFVLQMLGAPNGWKEEGGKFTSEYEEESYSQALSCVRDLAKAGYLHPDTFTDAPALKDWLGSGVVGMLNDNYTAWVGYIATYKPDNPQMNLNGMLPPGFDANSKPMIRRGSPSYSTAIIKKASKDRIREVLAVANYLAAPFGTKEYVVKKYGVPGTDYAVKNGDLVLTKQGATENALPIGYYACERWPIYTPGFPAETKKLYNYELKAVPMTIANPTVGLYSNTASTKGAQLGTYITDSQQDILTGRKPVSYWKDVVAKWRSDGGDTIRHEYEEAHQATT